MSIVIRGLLGVLLLAVTQLGLVAGGAYAAPGSVQITSPEDGARGPGTVTVSGTFSGTGVLTVDVVGQPRYPVTVAADGTWSAEVTGLTPGYTYSICAVLEEDGYQLDHCVSYAVENPGVPPVLDVLEPSDGATVSDDFTVWAQVYEFVDFAVHLDDVPVGGGSSSSSISVPLYDVAPGPHTVQITVWDVDGDMAVRTLTVEVVQAPPPDPIPAVEITFPLDYSAGPPEVVVSGTATVPSGTELLVHGIPTPVVDGTWSVQLSLDAGVLHTVCAEVWQTGGGVLARSCISYSAEEPAAPSLGIDNPVDGQVVGAEVYVSGWVYGATEVTLQVDGVDAVTVPVEAGASWWSATLGGLTAGSRTLAATATNEVGTTTSIPVLVTVDTTPPATPTVDKGATTIRALPHTVTGRGEPGSTICVAANGGACVDPVTVDGSGRWSYTFTEQIFDMDVDRADRSFVATYWATDGVNASAFVTVTYRLHLR